MLIQFSTGSVSDPETPSVRVLATNAGIQPSTITASLRRKVSGDGASDAVEKTIKAEPRQEVSVLNQSVRNDSSYELLIRISSPTLIITVQAETKNPLGYYVELVDSWTWNDGRQGVPDAVPLAWGFLTRGVPF